MSELPVIPTPDSHSQPAHHPKRNRAQLSCTPCRHGKLKCDRGPPPCSQCLKRGRSAQCVFPEPAPRRKAGVSMRERVRHLEGLVKSVQQNLTPAGTTSAGDAPSEAIDGNEKQMRDGRGGGIVVDDGEEHRYVGATHWAAILDDIEEVKGYFASFDGEEEESEEWGEKMVSYTMLTFNPDRPASKDELLESLPPRVIVDRLVARYFNSHSPALNLLHKPTFQKEYRKFWAAPKSAPAIWIGLLYAIMALANFATLGAGEAPIDTRDTPMEIIRSYRNCCMQALILSHYTKPGPYTIETLILYMEGEFLMSKDDHVHLYLLVGNIVRLSLRMGLHRDATKVEGNISPYQGEIRRRVWHHIAQIDLLGSFHIGLPGMVESIESDTQLPRNLRDEDWSEDMIELPPSRPDTELTASSYLICKSRLCHACGQISQIANRLTLPSYDEVMRMDVLLHDAYALVPSFYKMPAEFSFIESPELIVKQFSLALLFQKSRCMLHRKYITKEVEDTKYSYSRAAAIDASMELLRYHRLSYEAASPGGPLARDRWLMSTLMMHDFLLASMIVSINIIQAVGKSSQDTSKQDNQDIGGMVSALENAHLVFLGTVEISPDAKKAAVLLRAMLNKVNRVLGRSPASDTILDESTNHENFLPAIGVSNLSLNIPSTSEMPIYQDSPTQNSLQTSNGTPSTGLSAISEDIHGVTSTVQGDPFESMIDLPNDIDWDALDNHVFPKVNLYETWPNFSTGLGIGDQPNFTFGEADHDMLNGNNL